MLKDAAPVLFEMVHMYGDPGMLNDFSRPGKAPLTTKYVYLFSTRLMCRTEGQYFLAALWNGTGRWAVQTLQTPRMVPRPTMLTFTTVSMYALPWRCSGGTLLNLVITGLRPSQRNVLPVPCL